MFIKDKTSFFIVLSFKAKRSVKTTDFGGCVMCYDLHHRIKICGMTDSELPTALTNPYNPDEHESRINTLWREAGYANPDRCIEDGKTSPDAPHFSIVLPPPNVTGVLHIGHALTVTIEDIMVRYKRMQGYRTLWIPGTDHAAIATQVKAEKQLDTEGVKKQDLTRAELFDRIQGYAMENQGTIKRQLDVMGSSLDWSRDAFTLDNTRERAVRTAFTKMYQDGLIYRGNRVVNWDPKGRTTVSDDEVEHEEASATLYTFRYSSDIPITIATTRPETKLGDTAIAVHPDDERYQQYIGTTYRTRFAGVDLELTVIADEEIDMEYGTGALGVTPAHSMTDWQIAYKHGLPLKQVIDERARMTVGNDDIVGTKTTQAREKVAEWLRANSLMENEEQVSQNISIAQRGGGVIEPLPKKQWFVAVDTPFTIPYSNITGIKGGQEVTLKQLMRTAVEQGDVAFIPERYIKNYYHWIDKLSDWCISRQIVYGHRIPVWYRASATDDAKQENSKFEVRNPKQENAKRETYNAYPEENDQNDGSIYVGVEPPEGDEWQQDPDTLDTWFSSALWTFSTLGWPDETDDVATYHPTSMLETGHDILFFWIARMILASTYLLGDVPFERVYLHGTVRDAQGRTMSKSLGNGIDPMDMTEQYGTDALRMSLIVGNTPGTDLSFSTEKVKAHKLLANKLWNVARFVLSSVDESTPSEKPTLTDTDQQYLDQFTAFIDEITREMDRWQFHLTSDKLYNYVWHTFADVILEESKNILNGSDEQAAQSRQWLLMHIFSISLILLHPYMPFITEALWRYLPPHSDREKLLMIQPWPTQASSA